VAGTSITSQLLFTVHYPKGRQLSARSYRDRLSYLGLWRAVMSRPTWVPAGRPWAKLF
jgi:hypothetical protein